MFCSGVTVEESFFGLVVAGYGCRGAVLQTEQYSGGGAVLESSAGLAIYTIYTSGCYTHRGFTWFYAHYTHVILHRVMHKVTNYHHNLV